MKNTIITILVLALTMCNSQSKDKKIITGFLEQIVLKQSYEIKSIGQYIDVKEEITNREKEGIYQLLKMEIAELRKKLKDNTSAHEIVPRHSTKYSSQIKAYDLNYDNYDNVYYLIKDKEIVTFFIIGNKKIRAFFPGLTKKAGKKNPWILNRE